MANQSQKQTSTAALSLTLTGGANLSTSPSRIDDNDLQEASNVFYRRGKTHLETRLPARFVSLPPGIGAVVVVAPTGFTCDGARWRIVGTSTWHWFGEEIQLPVGDYSVEVDPGDKCSASQAIYTLHVYGNKTTSFAIVSPYGDPVSVDVPLNGVIGQWGEGKATPPGASEYVWIGHCWAQKFPLDLRPTDRLESFRILVVNGPYSWSQRYCRLMFYNSPNTSSFDMTQWWFDEYNHSFIDNNSSTDQSVSPSYVWDSQAAEKTTIEGKNYLITPDMKDAISVITSKSGWTPGNYISWLGRPVLTDEQLTYANTSFGGFGGVTDNPTIMLRYTYRRIIGT